VIHVVYEGDNVKGVFAAKPFDAGQVMEHAPAFPLRDVDWRFLSPTLLKARCRRWREGQALVLGLATLCNVSASPNAALRPDGELNIADLVALRLIEAGEEILLCHEELPLPVVPAVTAPVRMQTLPPAAERLTLVPGIGLEFVRVPAGSFAMGTGRVAPGGYQLIDNPQFTHCLPEYRLARYPITVAQFAAFVRATGYRTDAEALGKAWIFDGGQWRVLEGADWQHPRGPGTDVAAKSAHPVTQVSWRDAVTFCRWASEAARVTIELPSEPEWEKAARGTDGRSWCWGEDPPTASCCNFGWNVNDTTPVGTYSPAGDSPYGCADMAGNVWEWTADTFVYYPLPGVTAPESHEVRVARGGGFQASAANLRCAFRSWFDIRDSSNCGGFRVRTSG